ncbi:hypothetical protein XFF6166_50006 [Xanthomonas citri pv. fuscans]|nr:hypothetical protein XFF6166_50006 [Xanthomonas citri pv. fuscans]SOO04031.1 hypothetical protein XFF7767_210045 [Xanthomonas citri pv. fuscans]SOO44729.1 hypothetical protein XFF1815_620007 [Xanthomonas citri pv. fuscans]
MSGVSAAIKKGCDFKHEPGNRAATTPVAQDSHSISIRLGSLRHTLPHPHRRRASDQAATFAKRLIPKAVPSPEHFIC